MGTIHYKWFPFHSGIPEYSFLPGYCYYGRLNRMIRDHQESTLGFGIKLFTALSSGCHFGYPEG
jgi:hypothetical protein